MDDGPLFRMQLKRNWGKCSPKEMFSDQLSATIVSTRPLTLPLEWLLLEPGWTPTSITSVQVERDREKRWGKLHQCDYTTKMLEEYQMLHSRPVDTPMDPATSDKMNKHMVHRCSGSNERFLFLLQLQSGHSQYIVILECKLWWFLLGILLAVTVTTVELSNQHN